MSFFCSIFSLSTFFDRFHSQYNLSFVAWLYFFLFLSFRMGKNWTPPFIRLSLMCNIYTHPPSIQFNSIRWQFEITVWHFAADAFTLALSLTSIVNRVRSIHLEKNRKMICACTVSFSSSSSSPFDVWFLFYCAVNASFALSLGNGLSLPFRNLNTHDRLCSCVCVCLNVMDRLKVEIEDRHHSCNQSMSFRLFFGSSSFFRSLVLFLCQSYLGSRIHLSMCLLICEISFYTHAFDMWNWINATHWIQSRKKCHIKLLIADVSAIFIYTKKKTFWPPQRWWNIKMWFDHFHSMNQINQGKREMKKDSVMSIVEKAAAAAAAEAKETESLSSMRYACWII